MNKEFNERRQKVLGQVEYYLSDDNLSTDSFFHQKISESKEGYLNINLLLNCNKLKSLKTSCEEIGDAIKHSKLLELSKDSHSVRRINNKELPELKLLNQKRKEPTKEVKTIEKEDSTEKLLNDNTDENKNEDKQGKGCLEDIFLKITSDKEVDKKWKEIQDEYQRLNPNLNIVYMRFSKTEGHIGILHNSRTKLEFIEKFSLEGTNFNVVKSQGEDLIKFWKDHGSHYENCTKRVKRQEKKKTKEKLREEKNKNFLKSEVQLGNLKFKEVSKISGEIKNILSRVKDNEKLNNADRDFILDLLDYHNSSKEKTKNMDYITVSEHPEYKFSRCFFIVNKDGSKTDFSVKKCIEEVKNKTTED